MHVLPGQAFFHPAALLATVAEHRLTGLYVTPSILENCLHAFASDEAGLVSSLASLKVLWTTGERLTVETRARIAKLLPSLKVRNIYSTNESGDLAVDDGLQVRASAYLLRGGPVCMLQGPLRVCLLMASMSVTLGDL